MGCGLVSILERLTPRHRRRCSSSKPLPWIRVRWQRGVDALLVRLGRRRRTPSVLALSTEHGENENTIRNALIEPRKKNKPIMCMCNCMRFSLLLNVYRSAVPPRCTTPPVHLRPPPAGLLPSACDKVCLFMTTHLCCPFFLPPPWSRRMPFYPLSTGRLFLFPLTSSFPCLRLCLLVFACFSSFSCRLIHTYGPVSHTIPTNPTQPPMLHPLFHDIRDDSAPLERPCFASSVPVVSPPLKSVHYIDVHAIGLYVLPFLCFLLVVSSVSKVEICI
ncbi:hypothetical protein BDW22DRAFT_482696 [Trametopsis cervina]|nr:hypothetical protein BDW22DRAFT_482696 [Trametopsis cervina]